MIGYVDEINVGWVSGWFVGNDEVNIFVNDNFVCNGNVTGHRPDAGEFARSFYKRITRYLTPGSNRIVLKINNSLIPNGDQIIEYDPSLVVNQHWSNELTTGRDLITRWIQSDYIVQHVNNIVCGERVSGLSHGLFNLLKRNYAEMIPVSRAVSIGCGTATKELEMLELGLVDKFEVYDLALGALEAGKLEAKKRGLENRITFNHADGFESAKGKYDMVLWLSSLHHMSDVYKAVRWSREVLRSGGLFVMDEYVGSTRFQFPKNVLNINTEYRNGLKKEYLINPFNPNQQVSTELTNIDIDELILIDPSEAIDSDNILPAVKHFFPDAHIVLTGGSVYHCGMSDVINNFKDDKEELDRGLGYDNYCRELGITQFACAVAIK